MSPGIARAVLLLVVVGTVVYHGAKFYMDSLQLDTRHEVQEVETENTEEEPQPGEIINKRCSVLALLRF